MKRPDASTLAWSGLLGFTLLTAALRGHAGWLVAWPEAWALPVTPVLNVAMDWCVENTGAVFRAFSTVLDLPMGYVRELLNWMPWSVVLLIATATAVALSGWRLGLFTFLAISYMVVVGYWTESMNSLALVAISVPAAIIIGFLVGTIGFFSRRAERVILPTLDLLQTVPAFAYLLPILLLFGFGPVVGLIASVLYAFPPMVRNTMLGLARVGPEIVESGLMAGATPAQLFWRVRVPSALNQLLLGVNQTTMAAFSMVIIASIIGGTADIGWEVLSTMRKAQFGESVLAGIVIALMAMVMDRITAAYAAADRSLVSASRPFVERHRWALTTIGAALVVSAIAQFVPFLSIYPEALEVYPAEYLNNAVTFVIVEYAAAIALLKSWAFFFVMLPLKIGLEQTISPFSWGFEFTANGKIAYAGSAAALTIICIVARAPHAALLVAFTAILLFYGLTGLPWPAVIALATFLGWRLGGARLAIGTALGLGFLLVAGVWAETMLSVYLCGIAVLLSFVLGTSLGILAAQFTWVSRVVRPINDTLQTMPLFVILIPFVMIFKIGEFTALLAIMAYAIVPAIRYAEHGLRNVSPSVMEAATSMGATRAQLLWRVKLPLALPVIMLGLNQTIMYGIAMLVIAALVGTNGLGQQVYIGLGDGDFGVGMVAGIGMAIIAMTADRMTQGWTARRQVRLGIAHSE